MEYEQQRCYFLCAVNLSSFQTMCFRASHLVILPRRTRRSISYGNFFSLNDLANQIAKAILIITAARVTIAAKIKNVYNGQNNDRTHCTIVAKNCKGARQTIIQVSVFYGLLIAILPFFKYAYRFIIPNKQMIVKIAAAIRNGNGIQPQSLNYHGRHAVFYSFATIPPGPSGPGHASTHLPS